MYFLSLYIEKKDEKNQVSFGFMSIKFGFFCRMSAEVWSFF